MFVIVDNWKDVQVNMEMEFWCFFMLIRYYYPWKKGGASKTGQRKKWNCDAGPAKIQPEFLGNFALPDGGINPHGAGRLCPYTSTLLNQQLQVNSGRTQLQLNGFPEGNHISDGHCLLTSFPTAAHYPFFRGS